MMSIYSITEEDVDGCGTDATEFISSEEPLTENELQILKEYLDDVKQKVADEGMDVDTSDMVSDALNIFHEKTGKTLQFTNDIIKGYLTF